MSSDNKMVDIVGKKSGSKYTYDIAKESVKLIAYDCTDYYGDYKVSYKNGTLSINLLDEKYDIFGIRTLKVLFLAIAVKKNKIKNSN